MILSVVTGTFQRLQLLREMVESVRKTVPASIPYEFVIVDGGSTDGTTEWCKRQRDIVLIEQGELLGAIKAFNAGAMASRGQYVILGNDDILYHVGSIVRALAYMEDNPACGAVAFADNRHANYKREVVKGYGVQYIAGAQHPVIYAQVGMYRKWLGDLLGWWGVSDPVMREAYTYGGDAYLSARLWEYGYSVDAVRGVTVYDRIHKDDLRQHNTDVEMGVDSPFYKRYPQGVTVRTTPLIPPRDEAQMRTLYLPIYEPGAYYAKQKAGKRGLREAFARMGLVWEIDYCNEPFDLIQAVEQWQPDVLFLQLHSAEQINAAILAEARRRKPDMFVMCWNGDVWSRHLLEPGMVEVLKLCDLQGCVNASVLPRYDQLGIRARYWQCSFEPVDESDLPDTSHHDVVFTGNCYSEQRKEFGEFLYSLDDLDVGIYGGGWKRSNGNSTYDFPLSRAIYKNAQIIVGDNQYPDDYAFVSNRVFDTLVAGGGLLLHQHVPGMEEYTGITPDVHFIEWDTTDDLREKITYWLAPEQEQQRKKIVETARQFMIEHHSFDARLTELFEEILPRLTEHETVPV